MGHHPAHARVIAMEVQWVSIRLNTRNMDDWRLSIENDIIRDAFTGNLYWSFFHYLSYTDWFFGDFQIYLSRVLTIDAEIAVPIPDLLGFPRQASGGFDVRRTRLFARTFGLLAKYNNDHKARVPWLFTDLNAWRCVTYRDPRPGALSDAQVSNLAVIFYFIYASMDLPSLQKTNFNYQVTEWGGHLLEQNYYRLRRRSRVYRPTLRSQDEAMLPEATEIYR